MAGFDPDTFLQETESAAGFDPDTFLKETAPKSSGSWSDTAIDVGKSALSGIGSGLTGLVGLPGMASDLIGKGTRAGLRATGLNVPSEEDAPKAQQKVLGGYDISAPTPDTVQKNVEKVTGEFHKPKTTAGEYAHTAGEFAPGILAGPGGIARHVGMQVLAPAAASETAGQLTKGTAAEPYARIGAAVAAPYVASRLVTPFTTAPGRAAMVKELEAEGVTAMTAGQRTGNKQLQYTESALGDFPTAGHKATEAQQTANRQFTQATLQRIGLPKGMAPTREAVDKQVTNLEHNFEVLSNRNTARFDPQFAADIRITMQRYGRKLDSMQKPVVENVINDIAAFNGQMPGTVYQPLRSDLGRMAHGSKDPVYADALRGIQSSLDRVMERSMAPSDAALWQANRRLYSNWKTIQNIAKDTDAAGNIIITPARLKEAASARNRGAFARGQGDFARLAQAGQPILSTLPQSGTMPRTAAAVIPAALAHALLGVGSPQALQATVAAAATPAIAGRAIMSKPAQKYLGNLAITGPRDTIGAAALRGGLGAETERKRGGVTHRAGGGDTDQLPTAEAAPPAGATHDIMVHGYLASSGDHFIDDTGQVNLEGAPDASGMMAMPVYADGTPANLPQNYGFGPNYNNSSSNFHGTPFAPEIGGFGGGPAPAGAVNYDPSTNLPLNWQDFDGRGTSTGGGFFSFDQVYGSRPQGQALSGGRSSSDMIGGGGTDVPHAFQSGSSLPSTNNYRLLPPMYQKPNYIMRNGNIIDMNSYLRGPPTLYAGDEATAPFGTTWRSGASLGVPSAWAQGTIGWGVQGWPGQVGPLGYRPPGYKRGGVVRRSPRAGLGR